VIGRRVASPAGAQAHPHRFRLSRAGIVNVWQYDDQVFEFADGRLLLRGANGAGKSKTLEMLLPFVLDGDKLRMTASARHHTSLLWLMTDGYDGTGRVGYLWVEFVRTSDNGDPEWFTCGVGVRASQSTRTATAWYFTSPLRVGADLLLEDATGPLPRERCRAAVEADGHFFESPRQYKQHVGETLFGLTAPRYDELLRLLYWLRQPQVGEDIEPGRLAEILSVALPELDGAAVRAAGGTLDELAAFGEQLARRRQAATAMSGFARLYAEYARGVAAGRGGALADAHRELTRLEREVGRRAAELAEVTAKIAVNEDDQQAAVAAVEQALQRRQDLEASPEARSHQQLLALAARVSELAADATSGGGHASTARKQADTARRRAKSDADGLARDVRGLAVVGQSLATECTALGLHAAVTVPAALLDPQLDPGLVAGLDAGLDQPRPGDAAGLDAALAGYAETIGACLPLVGERQAAVRVVAEARHRAEQADADRNAAEREAARLEAIAQTERGRLAGAARTAAAQEESFTAALAAWRADERTVAVEIPDGITAETVQHIGALARAAAGPLLDELAATGDRAASQRLSAERLLAELAERRAVIDAEPDPAPAPPPLGRSGRDDADGAPLWRLVEFADHLDAGQRAGLEAALESAGLLDAWVRVDGRVLGADQRDVVLPSGPEVRGPSLRDVLAVNRPGGCPVSAQTIRGVLARIAIEPSVEPPIEPFAEPPGVPPAMVAGQAGLDGRWRLGPLTGLAAKPAAQYIGATARVAERARRLAEIDAQLTAAQESRRVAASAEEQARGRRASIEAWLHAVPPYGPLLAAWADVRAHAESVSRAQQAVLGAEQAARQARGAAAAARRDLDELGGAHGLPTTADGLAAAAQRLRALETGLAGQVEAAARQAGRLGRFGDDLAAWADLDRQAAEMEREAAERAAKAAAAAQRLAELRRTVEASVRELEERLAAARAEIEAGRIREKTLRIEHDDLRGQHGSLKQALADTGERRAGQKAVVADVAHRVAELATVPGLLTSAGAPVSGAYELARGVAPEVKVPAAVVELARLLAALSPPAPPGLPEGPGRPVTEAAVWNRYTEVTSGPAADCEPRVLEHPGMLAVVARDETGEHPLSELAGRLAAAVARDADLLTERERRVFEEHILGDLGEALRARRVEAEELVAAMNRLLEGVTTSQGVRVSLHWRLRDDVPADSRQAVALLGRPLGALLPDERRELRDCLHRLIETSRSEQPELSYAEHLGRALDYRQWFAFRVRYTRPELDGRWLDLHRRSPLSQGEQKVVCYLPLFAAAAAHFSSVAGAAPHAPRFVLLDDAFPKIDVRTHPLLFGLLVDLDLDFLITSERLWGDHETVPSLAIYEALRDPSQRGIAQYEHRWDGHRLHTVGA
jgi:uncharacterized protein (TIGR02680 family)